MLNYAQLEELPSSGGSPTLNEWDDYLEAGYRPPNPKMAKLQLAALWAAWRITRRHCPNSSIFL